MKVNFIRPGLEWCSTTFLAGSLEPSYALLAVNYHDIVVLLCDHHVQWCIVPRHNAIYYNMYYLIWQKCVY